MNEREWLESNSLASMLDFCSSVITHCCGSLWHRKGDRFGFRGFYSKGDRFGSRGFDSICQKCYECIRTGLYAPISDNRQSLLLACAFCREAWHDTVNHDNRHESVEKVERDAGNPGAERFDIKTLSTLTQLQAAKTAVLRDIIGNPYRPFRTFPKVGDRLKMVSSPGYRLELAKQGDHVAAFVVGYESDLMFVQPAGEILHGGNMLFGTVGSRGATSGYGRWEIPSIHWHTPTVIALAKSIYTSRDYDMMSVLSDALEEARCDDVDLLEHCRGRERCFVCEGSGKIVGPMNCSFCDGNGWIKLRGPHVRGCSALDALRQDKASLFAK